MRNSREILMRNIERRGKLLGKIRGNDNEKNIKINPNFIKFLDKIEKKVPNEEVRKEIYTKIFIILNRAGDLTRNKKPSTSNVTSIYNYSGLKEIKYITNIKEIKKLFSTIIENNIPFNSFTGMQAGKGIPDLKKLKELFEFCNENNISFNSVTGMQMGVEETLKYLKVN